MDLAKVLYAPDVTRHLKCLQLKVGGQILLNSSAAQQTYSEQVARSIPCRSCEFIATSLRRTRATVTARTPHGSWSCRCHYVDSNA